MRRELLTLRRSIEAYPDDASLWAERPGIPNTGGTLALHLAGNLQHFVGAVLGKTGYVRDRAAEFARRNVPRTAILAELDAAIEAVDRGLAAVRDEMLPAEYPLEVAGRKVAIGDFLVHLATHTAYHFTEAQLLKLPVHEISTSTAWTPRSTFAGPLLSDVLKAVGAYGKQIEIHTLDDYRCVVPVGDADRYGVVLAYSMNGRRLKVSDFGPLFLIYPRDTYPLDLTGAAGDAKFAWQIVSMTIRD